ncbi:MAG: hypothetical protein CSYNP_01262 [Syntrophus sp. SKADARSKE-3]|nr:hypothetical protein [Syntrophus sp. SKADARSKE-3]
MKNVSARKLLTCTVVIVFFLTCMPYGHANQSSRPATHGHAKIMEILNDPQSDVSSLSAHQARSKTMRWWKCTDCHDNF